MSRTEFGRLLREARRRSLLTLESLAEASGVSVRAIGDMERGQSLPRQATLSELMDALELDEEERRRFLEASVLRAEGHAGRVPRQLPPDLAVFRGRTRALETVREFTSRTADRGGHVVVSAIGGMAGVGKTAFAVHWAHRVADRFPDGQLYVNLRGFEDAARPLDPEEALGGFLHALGVPDKDIPRGTEKRGALFRERTASRRLIVVLDNARDEEQVRPLLPASAGCLTIITSRSRLAGLATGKAHSWSASTCGPVRRRWQRSRAHRRGPLPDGPEGRRPAGGAVRAPAAGGRDRRGAAERDAAAPLRVAVRDLRGPHRCWTRCRPEPGAATSGPCSPGRTGRCRRRRPCSSGTWPCTPARRCRRRPRPPSRGSAYRKPGGICAGWPRRTCCRGTRRAGTSCTTC
ncbi:helix-turn-helix domain-containing protein [Streptomyces diastatochromogenes]|nr:helix-turn-helix domain-containing protein [Streptomyces diastatochromogenes]